MKKTVIVYIYNSYKDPLFQGLLLQYLKKYSSHRQEVCFELITYEQAEFGLSEEERLEEQEKLKEYRINWHPLQWHSGSFKLIKKCYDLLQGFLLVFKLKRKYRAKDILTFTNIAGSFGFLFSRILGLRFIVYSYEPHSEFMADLGIWSRSSLSYKLLHRMEYLMGKYGEVIVTGTSHMLERLKHWHARGKAIRFPSCIDEQRFIYKPEQGSAIRQQLNIDRRKVVVYAGKFGDLYYKQEVFEVFKAMQEQDDSFFFLVLTSNPREEVKTYFAAQGIPEKDYYIDRVPFESMPDYLSAADLGVVAIPPAPSQKFRSPVKTGEYLLCGLPYIVCRNISEDDKYAEKYGVGVVMEEFSADAVEKVYPALECLMDEERQALKQRCRAVGLSYRASTGSNDMLDRSLGFKE